jgi:hypothetical protein
MQLDLTFSRRELSLRNLPPSRILPIALDDKSGILSYFSLALGVFILISTLVAITQSYSGMLFSDEWGGDPTPGIILHNLFAQHNEHRIVIPRLFFLVDKYLFAGSNLFSLTANVAAQLCTAIMLIGISWWNESGALTKRAWIVGLVLGLLFSGYQYENLFWGFQIQFFLVNTFAIAAFSALAFGVATWAGFLLAVLLGTVATFCMANGILALLILPLLAIALQRPWPQVMALATTFVVVLVIYLRGYQALPNHEDPIHALRHLDQVVVFTLTYLGTPIVANVGSVLYHAFVPLEPRLYGSLAIGAGLVGCVITAWYGYQMMRRPREFGAAHYALLATMAFVVGTAFVTALGRINFSIQQATASKYGTPVLIFWAAAFLLIWKARSLTWSWVGTRIPIFATLLLLALVVGQAGLSATAREWRGRELWVKTALLAGANDLDAFKPPIYFFPEQIADIGRALREERLSPFNQPWAMWRGTPLEGHVAIAGPSRCIGWFDTIEPIPVAAKASKTAAWRVLGWAWDVERQSAIEKIVLVDNVGQVVGFALSRLYRPDVVAHETRVTDHLTGWAGHVVITGGGEIRAYGLVDHDQSACLLGAHVVAG